ncbi:D-alanine--D-alanine ligase [Porphyromonas crevioricanis]|uniref:D-alanine--D-alanine ligase n=2 Tax=Porphyromonas crevioricanis TaxID=393921 RepID=A0A0A2FWS6_9PORP|nr:D-alanine--D-alanine ligase [Porphyromonas crevioricanis]KGN91047.1 D-alanine--D-alanine ligase [Porphyromonas crevioricanis]KGN94637.1 D-alanine--D-alanine ligase [Porphyromonas crevioricanis]SJZ57088.1 D-alanine-D-alanine ligase [Porphyromonas crevioricanis]SQH73398.1 D-alanine--D-alanine ligase B [Porphyromonas crevioricanis]GAD05355.1 D-alanine-D-alanine ligase [Porphyromonas crevioricanis JCM 15906]
MKPHVIAVVAGGYSGEAEVSLRSAQSLMGWIDRDYCSPYLLKVDRESWTVLNGPDGEPVDKPVDRNLFGFEDADGNSIKFKYAFITIHGTPGENGLLQGYLDMMAVPYNTGGVLTEALTSDKYTCNRYLSTFPDIHTAQSVRISCEEHPLEIEDLVSQLGLPLFVKPNTGGSSIATSRVDKLQDLSPAIDKAFEETPDVLVESLLSGTELTCGCYMSSEGLRALPVTEVVSKNEFFDYEAKYQGAVEEITPARISPELTLHIQDLTKKIYKYVSAHGIIRVDYIVSPEGVPFLLEVNTTPGMTSTSFIPQQVTAAGLCMKQVLTDIISQDLGRKEN